MGLDKIYSLGRAILVKLNRAGSKKFSIHVHTYIHDRNFVCSAFTIILAIALYTNDQIIVLREFLLLRHTILVSANITNRAYQVTVHRMLRNRFNWEKCLHWTQKTSKKGPLSV